jgi:hypothetical protein
VFLRRLRFGDGRRPSKRKNKAKKGKRRRAPIAVNGTVPPGRVVNLQRRPREYLTIKEVELLMEAERKRGRRGHRDATMILVAFRHGLRPLEVCTLRWDMIDLTRGLVHVRRAKNGTPCAATARRRVAGAAGSGTCNVSLRRKLKFGSSRCLVHYRHRMEMPNCVERVPDKGLTEQRRDLRRRSSYRLPPAGPDPPTRRSGLHARRRDRASAGCRDAI